MLRPQALLPHLPPARTVMAGAFSSAYFVLGPADGRPLVLCHGLAANGLQFVEDAQFFAAKGFRVIVPDLRGHGRSTCPVQRRDADFSITRLAADLIAILDEEGIAATDWVGNSLGGIVALSLMKSDRERLKSFASFGTAYRLDIPRLVVPFMQLSYKTLGPEVIARFGAPMTCRNARAQAVIYAMLKAMDIDAVTRIAGHVRQYDLTENARSYDGAMLMIRGSLDRSVNGALGPTLDAMTGRGNFELIDLSEAGHCANLDRPNAVRTAILDFLDG